MRAIVVDRWMKPAELTPSEVPEPELRPGTLKVEVRAAGHKLRFLTQCIMRTISFLK